MNREDAVTMAVLIEWDESDWEVVGFDYEPDDTYTILISNGVTGEMREITGADGWERIVKEKAILEEFRRRTARRKED